MFAMKYMNKKRTLEKGSIRNVLREIGKRGEPHYSLVTD